MTSEEHFNPRPPRGGRLEGVGVVIGRTWKISIHAPREGGDVVGTTEAEEEKVFQSTPPARGATALLKVTVNNRTISIHAPREGGDRQTSLYGRV